MLRWQCLYHESRVQAGAPANTEQGVRHTVYRSCHQRAQSDTQLVKWTCRANDDLNSESSPTQIRLGSRTGVQFLRDSVGPSFLVSVLCVSSRQSAVSCSIFIEGE